MLSSVRKVPSKQPAGRLSSRLQVLRRPLGPVPALLHRVLPPAGSVLSRLQTGRRTHRLLPRLPEQRPGAAPQGGVRLHRRTAQNPSGRVGRPTRLSHGKRKESQGRWKIMLFKTVHHFPCPPCGARGRAISISTGDDVM